MMMITSNQDGSGVAVMIKQIVCIALCVGICIATSCLEQRKKALEKSKAGMLLGAYVPQCEKDGSFKPKQCDASTGFCWCVTEEGKRINGTSSRNIKSCGCFLKRYLAMKSGLLGVYVPQCETNGSFKPKQCDTSTGFCWCVTKEGKRINGTSSRNIKSCGCFVKRYLAMKSGLLGVYVPQCEMNGSFKPKQCDASTGFCWCVNDDGVKITVPSRSLISCKCKKERYEITKINLVGAFVPKCKADGTYASTQCNRGTGNCWCVTEEGKRIDRKKLQNIKICGCLLKRYLAMKSGLLGVYTPKCDNDGSYSARQCKGNYCWCARRDGRRVNEIVRADKLKSGKCVCIRQEEDILKSGLGVLSIDCS